MCPIEIEVEKLLAGQKTPAAGKSVAVRSGLAFNGDESR
nr:hypothetical protein Josef01_10c16_25 [uncultured archaeon]